MILKQETLLVLEDWHYHFLSSNMCNKKQSDSFFKYFITSFNNQWIDIRWQASKAIKFYGQLLHWLEETAMAKYPGVGKYWREEILAFSHPKNF